MNKILIPILILLASCQNAATGEKSTKTAQPAGANHEMAAGNSAAIIDPVCGMVKDSTWTDYTVYKGDTVWFCAETEKLAFEGNPKKYEGRISKP